MPMLNVSKVEKLYLPSTKDATGDDVAWVDMESGPLTAGDLEGVNPSLGEINASYEMLKNRIVAWNLTEPSGEVAPITVENIKRLTVQDYEFLAKQISSQVSSIEGAEKKA